MKDIGLSVSRETMERLELYFELLKKWNPAINLVSKSTIKHAWNRHFVDSAQIYEHAPENWSIWADFGSGGGFPGAVVAIIASEKNINGHVILVESDQRKAAFLRNVMRETGVEAQIIAERIEKVPALNSDVISARALADLPALFQLSAPHAHEYSMLLFPKGANWQKEVLKANESWSYQHQVITSRTDPTAVILQVKGLARV